VGADADDESNGTDDAQQPQHPRVGRMAAVVLIDDMAHDMQPAGDDEVAGPVNGTTTTRVWFW
jgi:hypothetical protein